VLAEAGQDEQGREQADDSRGGLERHMTGRAAVREPRAGEELHGEGREGTGGAGEDREGAWRDRHVG
jgi:hypothetical protein